MSSLKSLPDISPEQRSQLKSNLPVQALRFGDGQHQHISLGLGQTELDWQLRWSGLTLEQVKKLDQFFKDHKGITAFGWTPPDAIGAGRFICSQWLITATAGGRYVMQARLKGMANDG